MKEQTKTQTKIMSIISCSNCKTDLFNSEKVLNELCAGCGEQFYENQKIICEYTDLSVNHYCSEKCRKQYKLKRWQKAFNDVVFERVQNGMVSIKDILHTLKDTGYSFTYSIMQDDQTPAKQLKKEVIRSLQRLRKSGKITFNKNKWEVKQ